jgi:transcriptional regulator with XRE-family HTH domain
MRAGTTQRHVSFIESGRSTPGRSMIIRLVESLEVPIRERNELLLAAGFAPAYPQTRLDDPQLEPIRTALERIRAPRGAWHRGRWETFPLHRRSDVVQLGAA